MKYLAALLAVCVLALGASAALAQKAATHRDEDIDADLVRQLIAALPDANETLVGEIKVTELLEEEDESFVVAIKPGKEYWIYGACDLECGDIDLAAENEDGDELDSDDEDDDSPILVVKSKDAHELHVTLSMMGCGETSCHAGFGVYEQP
jgi:hypothetical protein